VIHRFVFHNDRLVPIERVRLSPGQSGLLCGWGVFTTIRIVEGIPFAFERHWRRISRDAEKIHCPFPYDAERVRDQLAEVLHANQVHEGCARIYAIYNKPGYWHSSEDFPASDLVICSASLPGYHDPVRLGLLEHGRYAASPLAGVKVISWLDNVWSLHEAHHTGWDEVLLLNERGEVAECTAANIFCARDGRIATPPLDSGCLEGVTRGILLEIGAAAGAPVEERTLRPEDLYAADEVFISSTNRNVIAVSEIAGRAVGRGAPRLMKKLDQAFAVYVRDYLDARAAAPGKQ
jgi:branched-chain amino acid aminotransferase